MSFLGRWVSSWIYSIFQDVFYFSMFSHSCQRARTLQLFHVLLPYTTTFRQCFLIPVRVHECYNSFTFSCPTQQPSDNVFSFLSEGTNATTLSPPPALHNNLQTMFSHSCQMQQSVIQNIVNNSQSISHCGNPFFRKIQIIPNQWVNSTTAAIPYSKKYQSSNINESIPPLWQSLIKKNTNHPQ